ncbi:hypothetical protein GCM10009639_63960 [Kitasatospora putterlickiae]|uniref:Uncharacterized protein n=1 Tax=Kitasatospora putterlickiae TaxID=221725 RepID=A0ABN1YGB9_9ACTN
MDAAQTALALLAPDQLPSLRLLFTVRVADCHLLAHDPRAAAELLGSVLATCGGEDGLPPLARRELAGLRSRLVGHGLAG